MPLPYCVFKRSRAIILYEGRSLTPPLVSLPIDCQSISLEMAKRINPTIRSTKAFGRRSGGLFFMPSFNLYKVFKVHHFSLDFLFAGCCIPPCYNYIIPYTYTYVKHKFTYL